MCLAGATALLVALTNLPAIAKGTVRVDQHDGTVQTYSDGVIHIVGDTVRISSPDNQDTLIVSHAACSFTGVIQRCLPYRIRLHRNGAIHTIGFDHGTVYLNLSGAVQQLPRSSTQLPPNGVLVFVRTTHGTSIAVRGTIDEVAR